MATYVKDPDADLDYSFDWRPFLGDDSISTFTVTSSSADLTVKANPPPTNSGNVITFWLSGGNAGEEYSVKCHIETANNPPRKDDRTMKIVCRQK